MGRSAFGLGYIPRQKHFGPFLVPPTMAPGIGPVPFADCFRVTRNCHHIRTIPIGSRGTVIISDRPCWSPYWVMRVVRFRPCASSACTAELSRVKTPVSNPNAAHINARAVVCLVVIIGVLHRQSRGPKASSSSWARAFSCLYCFFRRPQYLTVRDGADSLKSLACPTRLNTV